jgi:Amt family ammonium transporter
VPYKLVDIVIGLRVPEEEEREGLDITSHGESAYHHCRNNNDEAQQ